MQDNASESCTDVLALQCTVHRHVGRCWNWCAWQACWPHVLTSQHMGFLSAWFAGRNSLRLVGGPADHQVIPDSSCKVGPGLVRWPAIFIFPGNLVFLCCITCSAHQWCLHTRHHAAGFAYPTRWLVTAMWDGLQLDGDDKNIIIDKET